MTCKFHCERPWTFETLGPGCQFRDETTIFTIDGTSYCRFHLPMGDERGNPTEKANWDEEQKKAFNDAVFEWIENARNEEEGKADLTGVVFPSEISFSRFNKNHPLPRICFHEAVFNDKADFFNAVFNDSANFKRAIFNGEINFIGAEFKSGAEFTMAAFNGWTEFTKATFEGLADFRGRAIDGPGPRNIFHCVSFEGTTFKEGTMFSNRRFLDWTSFEGATFHVAPEFHNAELHQDTNFAGTDFQDTASGHAARAYRTLKLAMGNVRARDEEAMFYAKEQKSLRHRDDTPKSVQFLSALYEITADYGRNVWLPLAWLGGITVIFWIIYLTSGLFPAPETALDFTVTQIVRPFSVWAANYKGAIPTSWKLFASLQSVLSLGLVTLFILAVRRRFRLN